MRSILRTMARLQAATGLRGPRSSASALPPLILLIVAIDEDQAMSSWSGKDSLSGYIYISKGSKLSRSSIVSRSQFSLPRNHPPSAPLAPTAITQLDQTILSISPLSTRI